MCVLLPIDGCHKGLFWSTVATLVANAIVKITNAFLQCAHRAEKHHYFIKENAKAHEMMYVTQRLKAVGECTFGPLNNGYSLNAEKCEY